MPGTARDLGVTDVPDPTQNVPAAIEYLSQMLAKFDNDPASALAGYNDGPNDAVKYVQPGQPWQSWIDKAPKETQKYIKKIMGEYEQGGNLAAAPAPAAPTNAPVGAPTVMQQAAEAQASTASSTEKARAAAQAAPQMTPEQQATYDQMLQEQQRAGQLTPSQDPMQAFKEVGTAIAKPFGRPERTGQPMPMPPQPGEQ